MENTNNGYTQSNKNRISIPEPQAIRIMDKVNPLNDNRQYVNLAIARLIRKQERLYTQHIRYDKKERYRNKAILDYKTNLFTNRLFYNISSKQLTKQEEQLLALGLKFTPDDHQATDTELFTQIDEYHTRLCRKYDSINMLKTTTEEPTLEVKRITGYIKQLNYKIRELYSKQELKTLTSNNTHIASTTKCHDSIDTIAINQYIQTCNTRLNKVLKTHPIGQFRTKQNKIKKTINNLKNDPTIIIKPADKNLGLVIMDTQTYIEAYRSMILKKTGMMHKDAYI
jgi:hypothetical protein